MTIFYLDIDSFFCALVAKKDRQLAGRPFVVSHRAASARVLSASTAAKEAGIHRGTSLSMSKKKLPELQVVPPNFTLFTQASNTIMNIVCSYSPRVEPRGFGRFALDMRGMDKLYPSYPDTVRKIQRDIHQHISLNSYFGIAQNKLVGAIAAKESQLQREALTLVREGDEARFLSPLPCRALPEWRYRVIQEHLRDLNLTLIAHIQQIPRSLFCLAIGPFSAALHEHAFGIDLHPVTPPVASEDLTVSHVFNPPTNDDKQLKADLFHLVEHLGFKLRQRNLGSDELRLFIRFRDGYSRRKQRKIAFCQNDLDLYKHAKSCFQSLYNRRQSIDQIAVSLRGLAPFHPQLELFPSPQSRHHQLQHSLDQIRTRFGLSSVRYAMPS
ncbi:MAG: hypothetical protein CSA81_04100 [Acidobacteria bacterium]|nr:MAG: hypothetical protein CSA81_04100 [Acidobacteriota bacterium]